MNPSPNGWFGPFQINYSDQFLAEAKSLQEQSDDQGLGPGFRAALEYLLRQIRQSARDFGEPLFNYYHLKLQFRIAVVRHLVIQYAVHHERPLVFLRKLVPLF